MNHNNLIAYAHAYASEGVMVGTNKKTNSNFFRREI